MWKLNMDSLYQRFSGGLVLALVLFWTGAAFAGDSGKNSVFHEISVGVLHHDTDHLWSGFSRESGVDINVEAMFTPSYEIFGGAIRPVAGASINSSGDTSKLYIAARWRYQFDRGVFFGLGVGGAVHDGETDVKSDDAKALGSRFLFHNALELGYRFKDNSTAAIYFDHVSNASLADPNQGLDTLGVRFGYRF